MCEKWQCPLITYVVNSYDVNSKDKTMGIAINLDSKRQFPLQVKMNNIVTGECQ